MVWDVITCHILWALIKCLNIWGCLYYIMSNHRTIVLKPTWYQSVSARTTQCLSQQWTYLFCLSKDAEKLPGIVLFLAIGKQIYLRTALWRMSSFLINCCHTDLKYIAGCGTNYFNVSSLKTWWNQASSDLAFWQSPNYFPGAHITQPPQKQFWKKPGQTLNQ